MKKLLVILLLLPALCHAQPPDTLRLMHYNLLEYAVGECMPLATKNAYLKTIFEAYRPDILTVNEMPPNPVAVNSLRAACLQYNPAMQATVFANSTGSIFVNMLYFNSAKLGFLSHEAITGNIRDIDVYRLYHKSATVPGDTLDLWCFVAHLKASQGASNEQQRAQAAADIADWLDAHPTVQRYLLCGDLNLYGSYEPAWQTLTSGAFPYFSDPSGQPTGWFGPALAAIYTQSVNDGTNLCATSGGLDNRFDFILAAPDMPGSPVRLALLPGDYRAYGNDGVTYQTPLDCSLTTSVPPAVCAALRNVSDHLPVVTRLLAYPPGVSTAAEPENTALGIELRSNPVRDGALHVWAAADGAPVQWTVWDSRGARRRSGNATGNSWTVPADNLPAGVYVLTVWTEEGKSGSARFVKM